MTRRAGVACALAAAFLAAAPAAAKQYSPQREFVLKQIKLPHHYYYREMYLPQVTSGPNSVTWSPDGQEVIYAMQGSLWRQRPASTTADQITAGPGYDHQPDWSPDGRFVAFATYHKDAIELRLLDLRSGATTPITSNGAVNVEPRWSRDGRRLAFVSTTHMQRFHVHVAAIDRNGAVGGIERLTEDHESDLPRYYYSAFDHFISPTWSPDGGEIILVSNRGRIWGTGGFWRMAARPNATPRALHHEETTWKARPDWSPDGRRVVYASYMGRQWHQLWLMPAEGGDVFPLTYGEFDATAPRWSPDGRRIAYISNAGGNTSLWIVDVPGGRRTPVAIRHRRHLGPVGRLTIHVRDRGGRAVPARLSVTGADGRACAPDDAWRHADEAFDRNERDSEYSYFHTRGAAALTVPAGKVAIEALRGLEHRPARREIEVPPGSERSVTITLERLADLPARGWYSGDLHVHMNYGGAYRNDPKRLALQAAAEDLHVIENLVVNKEQRIPDIAYFPDKPAAPWTEGALIVHGQEFHTSFWGHTALLGLRDYYLLPDYAAYANTAAASPFPHNAAVFSEARAQGAITGYVHPFDVIPDPEKDEKLTHGLPVEAALGALDYFEVVGFSDHLATATVWYRLLNCGFRIPAGAGTDAMANYASLRGPVGVDRVYVKTGTRPGHAAWLAGIRAGRTFATNGPLLSFTLGGKEIGSELRLPPGGGKIRARVTLRSIVPVERLEIVANGEVAAALPIDTGGRGATVERELIAERSGWYTVRAWSPRPAHPVLDIYPFATTSPIYVRAGDAPVRSPDDAAYFLAWVERLDRAARAHPDWNSAAEKDAVLRDLAAAREVYRKLSQPAP